MSNVRRLMQAALCRVEQSKCGVVLGALPMLLRACAGSSGLPVRWRSARRRAAGKSAVQSLERAVRPLAAGAPSVACNQVRARPRASQHGALSLAQWSTVRVHWSGSGKLEQMQVQGSASVVSSSARCGHGVRSGAVQPEAPNPSIERTSNGRLRLPLAAAHVERWASQ
jgi:hypothetical protein